MAYVLGGGNGESNGFEKAIANFALRAVHESTGLVNMTTVVTPTQGNVFEIPLFAPITYQDYVPSANSGAGDMVEQNPALLQSSITATPAVAGTAFDIFYGWTTSFNLAATLGSELGESFGEKVDQRVAASFTAFKATVGNTNYATSADGFTRPSALGAMELVVDQTPTTTTPGFTAINVLQLIRNVKQNFKVARIPGNPVIVLDVQESMARLLSELTGGAVGAGAALSNLGNELLSNGSITNIYGCQVMFTSFLPSATRTAGGDASQAVYVGAYISDGAIYTVMKQGLEIKMGEKPGGLQMWLTGVGYFGSGAADGRRGGAINIVKA
jgi:hypothetical protein